MKVKIESLDDFGRGIAKVDQNIIFIPNALPEEIVEIKITAEKKKYKEAIVTKYETLSPNRVEPLCPYYDLCGGCSLEHLSYEDTLKWKKEKVENILQKFANIKIDVHVTPSGEPYHYRNKITVKVEDGKVGYYKEYTHALVEMDSCLLAKPCINQALEYLPKCIQNGEVTIRCNENEELLIAITSKDQIEPSALESLCQKCKVVGIVQNGKVLYGEDKLYERIHNHLFVVSYDSFFQINSNVCDKVFTWIEKNLPSCNVVYDLYCGVGTLGIIASKKAKKVYGLEIVANAIINAITNAKLNHIPNAEYLLGDVKNHIDKIVEKPDCIIVDPPRAGLDEHTIETLLQLEAPTICYMSCDPVTLARDLKRLQEKYALQKCEAFDMFPYTYHVECCSLLCLRKEKSKK